MTARRVAAHRLGYERIPAPYGDPAADDALAAEVAGGMKVALGRMHQYLRARTAFFDRVVVDAIGTGTSQIVVGAAGYDGRSLRYAAPGVRWFEVDHPATQRDKLDKLGELGLDAGHVRFVAADFNRDPVATLLAEAGLDVRERSLFLLEGVAVYLEAAVVGSLLGQLRDVAGDGSRLAISMPVTGTARAGSKFRTAVATMGEPALSRFEPDEALDLLARAGWVLDSREGPDSREAAASRERLRSAGLLIGNAGPRAAPTVLAPAIPSARERVSRQQPVLVPGDDAPLPLSALLSHALVAFMIEADNEAEHRMPHRTTDHGTGALGDGPWLVSLTMYENCLRYLGDGEPRTVAELKRLARTGTNLDGMRRWGYMTVTAPGASAPATARLKKAGPDAVLRATEMGQRASQVWAPLPALIEERWRERFGDAAVGSLRDGLQAAVERLDPALPDCLPILGFGLAARMLEPSPPPSGQPAAGLPLNALLSRVLLTLALYFERESSLSLAISATVLPALTADGVRLRDLPHLTGVSKEAVSMAMTALTSAGLVVTDKEEGSRWQVARLTPAGLDSQRLHLKHLTRCEERLERVDPEAFGVIRDALRPLAEGSPPPLHAGLVPYPEGWRAGVRAPATLPRFPMVLHRGGYPDGS